MNDAGRMMISFRCPPELEPVLPRPVPAVLGLPDWFKTMPHKAFSEVAQSEQLTVKKCPPFIDAMTCGFLMPLVADLHVADGTLSWDQEVPTGALMNYSRSPIDFHDNSQVMGSPFYEEDRFLIKFANFWTFELPADYSLLITHPFNRPELPFVTLTGLVDADRYRDNFVNFPAYWHDISFAGVLPKGTPVAQCVPVKRDSWTAQFGVIEGDAVARMQELSRAVLQETGVYRKRFRAPKR
jgi:hypothetical protein